MDRGLFRLSRRTRRRMAAGGLLLTALATAGVLVAVWLARTPPGWWGAPGAEDASARATALENGVVNQLHVPRARDASVPGWTSEAWTVSLKERDADAWLAEGLGKWLANQSPPMRVPDGVGRVRVRFEDGAVVVGVGLVSGVGSGVGADAGARTVVTARLHPEVRADGSLWARVGWLGVGRLPMPAGLALERATGAGSLLPESTRDGAAVRLAAAVLSGREPLARDASLRLADGRRVRLVGLAARDGELWITCRTEAAR